MALQVQQGLARHVAQGGDLVRADAEPTLAEPGDVVELALRVHLGPRVPKPLIRGERCLNVGSVDRVVSHPARPVRRLVCPTASAVDQRGAQRRRISLDTRHRGAGQAAGWASRRPGTRPPRVPRPSTWRSPHSPR